MVNKIRIGVLGTCGKSNLSLCNGKNILKGGYKETVKAWGIRYWITNLGFSISNLLGDFKADFSAHTFKVNWTCTSLMTNYL